MKIFVEPLDEMEILIFGQLLRGAVETDSWRQCHAHVGPVTLCGAAGASLSPRLPQRE